MEIRPLQQYPKESLDTLLAAIPFYKEVKQFDQWQYDLLMSYSRIIEYRPGEVLLERGKADSWLYFLLKGQLAVYATGERGVMKMVNSITPGEVFGDLAVLLDHERTATVIADPNCKRAMVFSTDFGIFGALRETHKVALQTKLIYYRNMVHNLRWKLEVYRRRYPEHSISSSHHKVKLYTGTKGTFEELLSLDNQARELARLLVAWNLEFARSALPAQSLDSQSLIALG